MIPHGPWKILTTETVYRDRWLTVTKDDVIRPDGKPGTHSVARMMPGVSVLPLDADGTVYLTDEFHYGVGRNTLEVVSGGVEDGEDILEAARRELQEELGIAATDWIPLGPVDPLTTSLVSPVQLFLARNLTFVEAAPEGTELIRTVPMPLLTAVQKALDGEITHGPSCVLIFKAALWTGALSTARL